MDPDKFNRILKSLNTVRVGHPNRKYVARMPACTRAIRLPIQRCNRGTATAACPANHLHLWSPLHRGWYSRCTRCPRRWGLHSRGHRHSGRPASRFD